MKLKEEQGNIATDKELIKGELQKIEGARRQIEQSKTAMVYGNRERKP